MREYFPSNVVQYIEANCSPTQLGTRSSQKWAVNYTFTAFTSYLLHMVERIPDRILFQLSILKYNQFEQAVAFARAATEMWMHGDVHTKLEHVPSLGNVHPFRIIRDCLAALPDEGIEPQTSDLQFITDSELKEELRRDITNANRAFENAEWKAATVLAGSVVEAMLLDALKALEQKNAPKVQAAIANLLQNKSLGKPPPSNYNKWTSDQLIKVAQEQSIGLIDKQTAQLCGVCKDFRHLIHPGRALRLSQACNRGTAHAALGAVDLVVEALS